MFRVYTPDNLLHTFYFHYYHSYTLIELERATAARNKSSSRVVSGACERKMVTGSLITELCLGLVNPLLNWSVHLFVVSKCML